MYDRKRACKIVWQITKLKGIAKTQLVMFPMWEELGSVDYFLFLEICKQCRRKLEEASPLAVPSSESAEALEPPGEPNVAEPVERTSEDIAQVYNIAVTVTEQLKHELNSVFRVYV